MIWPSNDLAQTKSPALSSLLTNINLASTGQVESSRAGVEVSGTCEPSRGIDVPHRVHEELCTNIHTGLPHRLRPDEIPGAVQLADENVLMAGAGQVEGARARVEVGDISELPSGVDISQPVYDDAVLRHPTTHLQTPGPR